MHQVAVHVLQINASNSLHRDMTTMQNWDFTETKIRHVAIAVLFMAIGSAAVADSKSDRPNILFVFADDHAVHAIGLTARKSTRRRTSTGSPARACGSTTAL